MVELGRRSHRSLAVGHDREVEHPGMFVDGEHRVLLLYWQTSLPPSSISKAACKVVRTAHATRSYQCVDV